MHADPENVFIYGECSTSGGRDNIHYPQREPAAIRIAFYGRKQIRELPGRGLKREIGVRFEEFKRPRGNSAFPAFEHHLDVIVFFAKTLHAHDSGVAEEKERLRITDAKRRHTRNLLKERRGHLGKRDDKVVFMPLDVARGGGGLFARRRKRFGKVMSLLV